MDGGRQRLPGNQPAGEGCRRGFGHRNKDSEERDQNSQNCWPGRKGVSTTREVHSEKSQRAARVAGEVGGKTRHQKADSVSKRKRIPVEERVRSHFSQQEKPPSKGRFRSPLYHQREELEGGFHGGQDERNQLQ